MNPTEIIKIHIKDLKRRFGVNKVGVFGSHSRGDATNASDIDILVGFEQPVDIFTFIELKLHLEAVLKRKVDLVTGKALKPIIKDRILSEVIYL